MPSVLIPAGDLPAIPGSSMAIIERYAILSTLAKVQGSTSKASEILGISERKIQYRVKLYRQFPLEQLPEVMPEEPAAVQEAS